MKNKFFFFIISLIILIAVTVPRFNRNDIGIQNSTELGAKNKVTSDVLDYINIVKYFRGEISSNSLRSPFSDRPLVPYLASVLPFGKMTSLNIINFIALYLSILIIYKILTILNFNNRMKILGCLMFIISFPTFYYGVIGLIDPVLIFFILLALLFTLNNNFIALLVTLVVGAFVKETLIISVLISSLYMFLNKSKLSSFILKSLTCFILFGLSYYIARKCIPVKTEEIWIPYSEKLIYNLSRPRTYLSFILTLGVQGFISIFFLFKIKDIINNEIKNYIYLFTTGFVLSLLLFGFSVISAYSDGRFIWTSYPFTIPLSLFTLKYYLNGSTNKIAKYLELGHNLKGQFL